MLFPTKAVLVVVGLIFSSAVVEAGPLPAGFLEKRAAVGAKAGSHAFTYKATSRWGKLSTTCRKGTQQSPIDIISERAFRLKAAPSPVFPDVSNLTMIHNGHTVQVNMPSDASVPTVELNGNTKYSASQFHFHTPSEHHVNGKYFDGELHLVFNASDKLAVLGVFFDIDQDANKENEIFKPIFDALPMKDGEQKSLEKIEFGKLLSAVDNVNGAVTYGGSLTTPPCTEGVTWMVADKSVQTVSLSQYKKLKESLGYNARHTQFNKGAHDISLKKTRKAGGIKGAILKAKGGFRNMFKKLGRKKTA